MRTGSSAPWNQLAEAATNSSAAGAIITFVLISRPRRAGPGGGPAATSLLPADGNADHVDVAQGPEALERVVHAEPDAALVLTVRQPAAVGEAVAAVADRRVEAGVAGRTGVG